MATSTNRIWRSAAAGLLGLLVLEAGAAHAALTVGNPTLISQQRLNRFVFQLEYRADVTNTGSAGAFDVQATLSTTSPGITIIDDSLTFGDVAPGSTVSSTDTFIIYQDRRYQVTESDFVWTTSSGSFRAIADCAPQSGSAPLTVRFQSRGEFSGGSIVRYRWDFDGDGDFETSDAVARDYTRVYDSAGEVGAVLEVLNNFGETATDVCPITVAGNAPTAVGNVTPSNGPIPLEVDFTCDASDPDGSIALYEWDFEGDGSFDYSSPTTGDTQFTYTTDGAFEAVCRVTDDTGLSATARVTTTVVRPGPVGSPQVTASASPTSGFAPLNVSFNGSATDADGNIVLWEWDFEGDGVFDYSSSTGPAINRTFEAGGIFAPALRVTDDDGLTGTDTVEVVVNLSSSLSVTDDTLDAGIGETTVVRTTLGASVPARVVLRNQAGSAVRTLFDGQRAAGTYDDVWDGTDDGGDALPQGVYYAVLEYDFAGGTRTVDLTNTTGGVRYNPSRTGFPRSFTPYADDLLDVTFTIPQFRGASEVEAFIGLFNVNTRIINLLNREPLGVGQHTIAWDGITPQGDFAQAPPGDRFLFGIFAYTLPDNAILLQRAPRISNVSVHPNFYNASVPDYLTQDNSRATINYTLSGPADVELRVTNLDTGLEVRRVVEAGVQAGPGNAVIWDGRTSDGRFADQGEYRLALRAVDGTGSTSIARYVLVRVQH